MSVSANLLSNPVLRAYALSVAALVFNLVFLALYTGAVRGKNKSFASPEDRGYTGSGEHPSVTRALQAHRNALENFLPFFALATVYVLLCGASPLGAQLYCGVFAGARWLHTASYLAGKQPYRTLSFLVGVLCMLGLIVQILVKAFSV